MPSYQVTSGGDVFQWLEDTLEKERRQFTMQLEQNHRAIVTELRNRITERDSGAQSAGSATEEEPVGGNGEACRDSSAVVPSPNSNDKKAQGPKRSPTAASSSRSRRGHSVFGALHHTDSEMSCYERVRSWVRSDKFEVFFGGVIVVSAIFMALEMQYRGLDSGFLVQYETYGESASSLWPWADDFFTWSENILGVFFTIELVLKLFAQHMAFFKEIWNWIDVLIVGSWLVTAIAQQDVGFNPTLLRLVRLMRLLRLLKLLGMISIFDSLYLMTTAIKGSVAVLMWAVLVLTVVEMLLACLLQSMVEDYVRQNPGLQGREVFKYFGSFARSMLTMFEMTLGNWIVPARALVENVSEWYMLFFLMHKFIIGFSVVSVITGVFIQETFKVATTDNQIMLRDKARLMKAHERKMKELFMHADSDKSGKLEYEEFIHVMELEKVKMWLSSMGLDVEDSKTLFELVKDGDDHVNAEGLVQGAGKLKGTARSIDLNILMNESREFHKQVGQILLKVDKLEERMGKGSAPIHEESPTSNGMKNWFQPC